MSQTIDDQQTIAKARRAEIRAERQKQRQEAAAERAQLARLHYERISIIAELSGGLQERATEIIRRINAAHDIRISHVTISYIVRLDVADNKYWAVPDMAGASVSFTRFVDVPD